MSSRSSLCNGFGFSIFFFPVLSLLLGCFRFLCVVLSIRWSARLRNLIFVLGFSLRNLIFEIWFSFLFFLNFIRLWVGFCTIPNSNFTSFTPTFHLTDSLLFSISVWVPLFFLSFLDCSLLHLLGFNYCCWLVVWRSADLGFVAGFLDYSFLGF